MRVKDIVFGIITVAAVASQVRAANWDYGATTTNWDDAANWNPNGVPSATTANSTGFILAQSPVTSVATSSTISELQVGVVNSGFLTINGGSLTVTSKVYVGMFTNGVGTVTQNSGTLTTLDFALGFDNQSKGTYNLTGGTVNVTGLLALGSGNSAGNQGDFNHSGGLLNATTVHVGAYTSNRTGTMTVSGSAQTALTGDIELGFTPGSSGKFVLDGSRTGAGTNFVADEFKMGTVGTLMISIDTAAITNSADMRKIDVVGANFGTGSILDLGFSLGATPTSGTWTVLTAAGAINNSGIVLNAADILAGWSFNILTNPTGPDSMTITYTAIPEPSTLALLGGVGAMFMVSRRRKAAKR